MSTKFPFFAFSAFSSFLHARKAATALCPLAGSVHAQWSTPARLSARQHAFAGSLLPHLLSVCCLFRPEPVTRLFLHFLGSNKEHRRLARVAQCHGLHLCTLNQYRATLRLRMSTRTSSGASNVTAYVCIIIASAAASTSSSLRSALGLIQPSVPPQSICVSTVGDVESPADTLVPSRISPCTQSEIGWVSEVEPWMMQVRRM